MASIDRISKAYDLLKNYKGDNGYINSLYNSVYVYKNKTLNDFHVDFIIENYDFNPIFINKNVKVAEWWGKKRQEEFGFEFTPSTIKIGWYMGKARGLYVFYARYRKSQEKGILTVCPIDAVFTDFLLEDYSSIDIDFSKYNTKERTLRPHQEEGVKFLVSRKKCILADEPGAGKEIDVDTMLPTPDGYRKASDINVGDYLYASNGKKTKVIGKFPQGLKDIYNVTFNGQAYANCGLEHLWIVKDNDKENPEWEVKAFKDIIDDGFRSNRYEIPVCEPVERIGIEIEGSIRETVEKCLRDKNRSLLKDIVCKGSISQRQSVIEYLCDKYGEVSEDGMTVRLTCPMMTMKAITECAFSLGGDIISIDFNKDDVIFDIRVPFNPFVENDEEREKYKGHTEPIRRFIIGFSNDRKKEAVCFKVDSEDESFLTENYVVTHNTTQCVVASLVGGFQNILVICPASVKTTWKRELSYFVPEDDISIIESFDGLNKQELEEKLGYEPGKSGLKKDELLKMAKESGKWIQKKYTIVNYDILDEFYTIPMEKRVYSEKDVDENGNVFRVKKEKTVVSRNKNVISKAMGESEMFKAKFDLIIIDEAHKLSNMTSARYKIMYDFVRRSNPKAVYCCSGTPITNSPFNFYNILKIIDSPIVQDWQQYVKKYCNGERIFLKGERQKWTGVYLNKVGKSNWYQLTDKEKKELDEFLSKNAKSIWKHEGGSGLDELRERVKGYYLRREQKDFAKIVNKTVNLMEYELTQEQMDDYNRVYDEFVEQQQMNGNNVNLMIEGVKMRQWISMQMIPYTLRIVRKHLENGEKVIIMCCFDEEIYKFKEILGDISLIYNGKISPKEKVRVEDEFMNNPAYKVLIGNINACGVGLTLTAANICVFNNFSWTSGDNEQAEDRIYRLSQTKDCIVYYQLFKDTFYEKMFEKVKQKEDIINKVIVKETDK